MIESYLQTRISTPVDDITIKESLDETMIDSINKLNDPALFFVSNNLHVNPTKITNPSILAGRLSPILGVKEKDLEMSFVIKKKAYLVILNKMNIQIRDLVKKRIDTEK